MQSQGMEYALEQGCVHAGSVHTNSLAAGHMAERKVFLDLMMRENQESFVHLILSTFVIASSVWIS